VLKRNFVFLFIFSIFYLKIKNKKINQNNQIIIGQIKINLFKEIFPGKVCQIFTFFLNMMTCLVLKRTGLFLRASLFLRKKMGNFHLEPCYIW
jgi:hypothetical protein